MIRPSESTVFILKALIPYSQPGLKLAFKPAEFFNELERIDGRKKRKKHFKNRASMRTRLHQIQARGMIEFDEHGQPRLTQKAYRSLEIFEPKKLKGAVLLVAFDVPEIERQKRGELRAWLRALRFKKVQQSVWQSRYDGRRILLQEIQRMGLKNCVSIYEARVL